MALTITDQSEGELMAISKWPLLKTVATLSVILSSLFLVPQVLLGQSDPQAVVLVQQAYLSMTGGTQVMDQTMTGTARWIFGSENFTATVTLKSKGTGKGRLDIQASYPRYEIRNDAVRPAGQWTDGAGNLHQTALHNCSIPAGILFPISVLRDIGAAAATVMYVGRETQAGIAVDHLRYFHTKARQTPKTTALLQRLSTVDVYLAASSHQLLMITFNVHPPLDAETNVPAEIDFADYRLVNGITIPYHIRRLLSGLPNLDFSATSVAINSGLPIAISLYDKPIWSYVCAQRDSFFYLRLL